MESNNSATLKWICKMKNLLDGLNSVLKIAEEFGQWIYRSNKEVIYAEEHKELRLKKWIEPQWLMGHAKRYNICVNWAPEKEERMRQNVIEKIMSQFSKFGEKHKSIDPYVQQTPNRMK